MIKFHFAEINVVGLNKVGKSSAGAVLTAASSPARRGLVPKSLDLQGLGTRSLFSDPLENFFRNQLSVFAQG